MTFAFGENRHEDVGAGYGGLPGPAHMLRGPAQHPADAAARDRLRLGVSVQHRRGQRRLQELVQITLKLFQVHAAGKQYLNRVLVLGQCTEEMLEGHELVPMSPRQLDGVVKALLKVAR